MIKILCVGKIKEDYLQMGIKEYLKRMESWDKVEIVEVKEYQSNDINKVIESEGNSILEKISKVDQEGKELNDYFASLSEEKREEEFGVLSIKAKMLNYKKQSLLDILYMVRNNQVVNLGFGNCVMKLFRH